MPWCSYRRRNHRNAPRRIRPAIPTPQTKNTPITASGNTSSRAKPKGLRASHKDGHRKKSNILTSKNTANSKRASTRISDGNEPNLSRFANQMAAVPAPITNQLWNSASTMRWWGEGCPSLRVRRRNTAARTTMIEPIHEWEDFRTELEISWSNLLPTGGLDRSILTHGYLISRSRDISL